MRIKKRAEKPPAILKKMAGFLFIGYIRNKTLCKLICYVILGLYALLLITIPVYSLTVSTDNYSIQVITFLNGAGAISSGGNLAVWTAVGEGIAFATTLGNDQYSTQLGQLFLFTTAPNLPYWVVSNLQAKTDILGLIIPEKTWQKDADPYFYWQADITPPDSIDGYSVSLDTPPKQEIVTTEANYQFAPNSITSGKHTFYVLPYTLAKGWDTQGLSFEIWVDVDAPIVSSTQPAAGTLTSNNLIPISCSLSDAHSGVSKIATTLTVNNNSVLFDYDADKQILTYTPSAPYQEGDNAVLLKAVDNVGNFTTKGWNFVVDTQPPTGSILINNGQQITHSAYVSINIDAKDAISGVKNIYLSNDGVFDTELNQPYPYSPVIANWLLRDPDTGGQKTVYVKFEDFAGNLSQTYQANITLELMTPNTRIISGPPTITEETSAAFTYEASREGCLFSYRLDNLDWSTWQSGTKAEFSGLAEGNHYFYVKAGFDLNGDGQITIDEEDPTPAQWVWTVKPKGYLEKLRERVLFWRR